MGNFYLDNPDIGRTLEALDLSEVAALLEEDFRFASEFAGAPKDAADALDNYRRALTVAGEVAGNRIAATAEETDRVGNVLNDDGSVTYAPGIRLALDLLARTGLMGVQIPYALDGLNMPCAVLTAANDIVSRADASLMNLFGLQGIAEIINLFGDDEMNRTYVPRLARGEWTGAMALTEPDAGSDLQSVKTSARQDAAGNWFVNGVKRFITNGCGDVLLVLARTEPESSDGRGLSCLLVEKGPWVRVRRLEHKLGINGSPTCELVFTEAPAKLVGLRKRGLVTYVMALMNGARVGIAAQGTGIGEAAYRAARAYAASRRQFGGAIDELMPVRGLLAGMSVDVQAARALTYFCAKCVDLEGGLERRLAALKGTPEAASVRTRLKRVGALNKMLTPFAKYYASEMSMRVSNGAVAVLGGSGFMKDYPVERYLRDARITTIYEGTSQLQVVAAGAGVMGGLLKDALEEIWAGVAVPAGYAAAQAETAALADELEVSVAAVRAHPGGKAYADLAARSLVDAAVAATVGALFVRFVSVATDADWRAAKAAALGWWRAVAYPAARAALAQARAGYFGVGTDFARLAPSVPAE